MRRIFDRFETRGNLLSAMMRRTGADLASAGGLAAENTVRQAINRCLLCRAEEQCKGWLASAEQGAKPPAFCPNAALLSALRPSRSAGGAEIAAT